MYILVHVGQEDCWYSFKWNRIYFITGSIYVFVLGGMNPVDFLKLLGLPLTLASLVNIVIAFIVSKGLKNANIQV